MRLPTSDRERARLTRFTFVLHLRPVRVPARALRWTHTYGLGGSSLVLVALLALTGIFMMLVYQPVPEAAHASVGALQTDGGFGPLVRGVHYWSANLLIVVMFLHMGRVFLTGGYGGARATTWIIGLILLLSVLTSSFTGYLLPWDQRSYWAITISTGMLEYIPGVGSLVQRVVRGGDEIGARTLTVFYTLHTTIVPVVLIASMAWHFWRVRRARGVIVPPAASDSDGDGSEQLMFVPHLMVRELSQAAAIVAVVVLLGALVGAPLGEPANPGMSPNPAKAPWYFVGFQELLIHLHPLYAVFVLPSFAALGLLLLPRFAPNEQDAGRWFLTSRGRRATLLAAALALTLTPALVLIDDGRTAGQLGWLMGGLLPSTVLVAVVVLLTALLRRALNATREEAVQVATVMVTVAFLILTVIGVWFRGEGMRLVWPWAG